MRSDQTDSGSGSIPGPEPHQAPGGRDIFPTNAVVGVIHDPRELTQVVQELRTAGFQPVVLHGELGEQRIRQAGDAPRDLRLARFVQELFGYEAEHTERHMQEVEAGNFIVVVESHDDETTERARTVFVAHGGRFVNYYSRWTSQTLVP